ncbi:type I-E CRISPR-associated protein Cas6/Cse3/CasE [Streptomyces sp. NPDC059650]|uniref:type I-E CRISPR-associated protein Cas6/Cse3/CasE n=1 Tax=Streptomyces sp. NPDC059650 TaxID=3346896 RepID=UPI0036863098
MPYLSRIPLAPLRSGARKLLRSEQAMHAAVLGATSYHADPGRSLWRLDPDDKHKPYLYAVTQVEPDWTALVEQAGWAIDTPAARPAVADYKPLLDRLSAGQTYRFRLSANPVHHIRAQGPRVPGPDGRLRLPRGRQVACRTAAQQLDWISGRNGRHGFTISEIPAPAGSAPVIDPLDLVDGAEPGPALPVLDVKVTRARRAVFSKATTGSSGSPGGRTTVTLDVVVYEGTLTVTDPPLLAQVLVAGIGSGKAYGCGMLTLARPAG